MEPAHDGRHDNRVNALTTRLFLDDKNWIAVDNHTDVNGGPNAPRDGKIGTMYICWSFDGTGAVPLQQIVVMRSLDGGKTWGGHHPRRQHPVPGQPEDADLRHRLPHRDRARRARST